MPAPWTTDDGPCPLCSDPANAAHLALVVHADLDRAVLGRWCPSCALPSAFDVPTRLCCDHGWPMAGHGPTVRLCADCGQQVPHR